MWFQVGIWPTNSLWFCTMLSSLPLLSFTYQARYAQENCIVQSTLEKWGFPASLVHNTLQRANASCEPRRCTHWNLAHQKDSKTHTEGENLAVMGQCLAGTHLRTYILLPLSLVFHRLIVQRFTYRLYQDILCSASVGLFFPVWSHMFKLLVKMSHMGRKPSPWRERLCEN